jgi:hypothetical protein
MDITVNVIPHFEQRYPTTGDWRFYKNWTRGNGDEVEMLSIAVSEMGDWRYEFLIAVHEIIEAGLCKHAGIDEPTVKRFDELYEIRRTVNAGGVYAGEDGPYTMEPTTPGDLTELYLIFGCNCIPTADSEPGDDIHAPYYKQHQLATSVERMLTAELEVDWNAYEAANLALYTDEK